MYAPYIELRYPKLPLKIYKARATAQYIILNREIYIRVLCDEIHNPLQRLIWQLNEVVHWIVMVVLPFSSIIAESICQDAERNQFLAIVLVVSPIEL
jgi:hypothetical protein